MALSSCFSSLGSGTCKPFTPNTADVQGCLANKKTPTPLGHSQAPRHRPSAGSWGVAFSYGRGTPVTARGGLVLDEAFTRTLCPASGTRKADISRREIQTTMAQGRTCKIISTFSGFGPVGCQHRTLSFCSSSCNSNAPTPKRPPVFQRCGYLGA